MTNRTDPRIVLLVAGHAGACSKTAAAWLSGRRVRGAVLNARLEEAAKIVGVERSPAPPSAPSPSSAAA